jgi:phage terminase small subunit
MSKEALTEKQRRFVEAYMGAAAGNATEAARLAGYSGGPVTLASVGKENLRKPPVLKAINERRSSRPDIATREERQRFWSDVMRGAEEAEMKDRLKASELLGKTQLDFKEVHVHEGSVAVEVTAKVDLSGVSDEALAQLAAALKGDKG